MGRLRLQHETGRTVITLDPNGPIAAEILRLHAALRQLREALGLAERRADHEEHRRIAADMHATASQLQLKELRATLREVEQILRWADRQFSRLVTEDEGTGVFVRGRGIELAGFEAGRDKLREAIHLSAALTADQ